MSRQAVLDVLGRAGRDNGFIGQLTDEGSRALKGYSLTADEAGALVSGDIRWLEAHVGKLNEVLSAWPNCRLQQAIW
jgi:molybdenum-dependent DNA-binding transcriptional regulator ModE